MHKNFRLFTPIIYLLMALCALLVLLTAVYDSTLFFISAAVTLIGFVVVFFMLRHSNQRSNIVLREISDSILFSNNDSFTQIPLSALTVYEDGEIIWYNDICAKTVFQGCEVRGEQIENVLPGLNISETSPPEGVDIELGSRSYTAFIARGKRAGADVSIVYLVDDTDLKYFSNEYYETLPSVSIVMVDNYEEMVQDYKETERAQLMSEIEDIIQRYVSNHHGFIVKIERDKYMAVIQERGLKQMIQQKFNLLDQVRAIHVGNRMNATLSIGVGREAPNLFESEAMARQALDMCLGRGGDQATVKNLNGYEFYGGVSKGIEKRTKVKSRIIASAIGELIENSENVLIMGHRFADLDCLGSAVGMFQAAKAMDRPAKICMNKEKNLVHPLLEKLERGGYTDNDFVDPESAISLVTDDTLLIVVDTHLPHVLESEALYRACDTVIVIDHHRKLVGFIDNAVVFYHEPYASSASEMVAELVQYFPKAPRITKLEAEALLAGIMLDTKNFVLRTGVRTFEAAAYLRRQGADTVEVRGLFASSMDNYQQKTSLVANAEIYQRCAIAASDYTFEGIKMVAPQAADELMTISNVDASFVIFLYGDEVSVSARSMGALNVQVIMETLGGGGHHTMAAAQFPGETIENIREKIMLAIDDYYASQNMLIPEPDKPEAT